MPTTGTGEEHGRQIRQRQARAHTSHFPENSQAHVHPVRAGHHLQDITAAASSEQSRSPPLPPEPTLPARCAPTCTITALLPRCKMAAGPRSAPPGMPRGALHAEITSPGMQRARWDSLHCACVPVTSLKRDEPLPVGAAAAGRRDAAVAGSRDLARARVPAAGARPALAPRPAAQPGDGAGAARAHRGAVGARRRDARLRGAGERRGRAAVGGSAG